MPPTPKKYLRYFEITFVVLVVIMGACMLYPGLTNIFGIATKLERRTQREQVLQRVQAAGGWNTLQKDCISLARTNQDQPFNWSLCNPTNLPPAIAALKPMEVRFYQGSAPGTSNPEPYIPVVHIRIFGIPSSGGFAKPYYGLDVVTRPTVEAYQPKPAIGVPGNRHKHYRKITNTIYEIY